MLRRLNAILEMIKFGHSVFALPFAVLAGLVASQGRPGFGKLALIVACMILGRNVAMAYNRLADRDLDKLNPRTASRAIPAGLVSPRWTAGFIAVNAAAFIMACGLFERLYRNPWPVIFSAPVLAYLCLYSHSKRYTWLCHFWLGGAHVIAVLAGFVAINPHRLGPGGMVLAVAVGLWTAGFDIIYATLDVDFDRRYGIHSLPARLGVGPALRVSGLLHALCILGFASGGYLLGFGRIFGVGVALTAALLVVEHRLVGERNLRRVNMAFFTMNGAVSVLLAGFGLLDLYFSGR
jgi:4-hydroxybenzoate polyprenyltransferase